MHIKESVDSTIEDKIASPLRTVRDMYSDLAFSMLDLSTEIRAKTSSLAKFDKKFGTEETEFIAKRVRTKDNKPVPIQASELAEATEAFTKIQENVTKLDLAHQKMITAEMKQLSQLELTIAKDKRMAFFIEESIDLFRTFLEGYRSKDIAPEETEFSDDHIAGWYLIHHLLAMKDDLQIVADTFAFTTKEQILAKVHKKTFMRNDVQNIINMINQKHFDEEIYEGFLNYCYTHILTQGKTSMLFEVTVEVHVNVNLMIEERKEEATMKAARTAVEQTDAAEETARKMAEMTTLKNSTLGSMIFELVKEVNNTQAPKTKAPRTPKNGKGGPKSPRSTPNPRGPRSPKTPTVPKAQAQVQHPGTKGAKGKEKKKNKKPKKRDREPPSSPSGRKTKKGKGNGQGDRNKK